MYKRRNKMSTKNTELNIRLHSIEELEYKSPHNATEGDDAEDMGVALQIRTEKDILSLLIEIAYLKNKETLSKLKVKFNYEIEQLNKIIQIIDDNSIRFKVDIIPDLFRIAIDTMRGIYYEKLKNTALCGRVIPLINPKTILEIVHKDQKEKALDEKE